jgi:hypothetical protein
MRAPTGGHPLPAASPSTHIPTLPPRGPAAARHIGVALILCSAVAVIVVLVLALVLPSTPRGNTLAPPAIASGTQAPIPTTTTTTTDPELVPVEIDALAPVPLTMGPADGRLKLERTQARRGLRLGDVPALDALIAKATALEKAGRGAEAMGVLKEAHALADRQAIDRGFVFAKQKRLNLAVDDKGTKDGKRFDELAREVERRFAARDYAGANDTLNKAFALLR